MKNKTLEFFSRALPILQADESLPKVTKYQQGYEDEYYNLWVVTVAYTVQQFTSYSYRYQYFYLSIFYH